MRYNVEKWTHEKAVHYSALISDFLHVTRKLITKDLKEVFGHDSDVDYVRLRTRKGTEFIITSDKEFSICVVQNCNPNGVMYDDEEDNKEGAAE